MKSSIAHIQQLRAALQAEYAYEKAYFQQQKQAMGLSKLIHRGECWWPLRVGATGYNSLGELTIEVFRSEEQSASSSPSPTGSPSSSSSSLSEAKVELETREEEVTKFEPMTAVTFFRQVGDGTLHYMSWNGTVNFCAGDRMVVAIPKNGQMADLLSADQLGVQLAFNERTYQLEFEALNKVEKLTNEKQIHLREVLIGSERPSFQGFVLSDSADKNCTILSDEEIINKGIRFPWLNLSQEVAVNKVLAARDVMIVHGPPGTGKTTTLLEAIYETLRREPQVLVCAQSNAAVDWIASQLLDRAVPVLRIGNPTRVTDKMLSSVYERQFADHPSYPELWNLRRTLREGVGKKGRLNHDEKDRLRERMNVLEAEIRGELFQNAKVIACTLAGAGHPVMQGQQFHTLFIDEAAQATEPACWIAIRKAQRVIMAGDHCQLPPTLKSPEAAHGLLARTLMEHVATTKPEAVSLLTMQYRMHPDIMQFSSEWFYEGRLTAAESVRYRGALDVDSALIWLDTKDCEWKEAEQREGTSRYNKEEAHFLVEQLEAYADMLTVRKLEQDNVDFAVISPYQAQIHLLRHYIKCSQKLRPIRRRITVETVDAFQGQERDVVILSLVRANDQGQIGFLQDLRRMNVAMTRARHKLIIIGSSTTLGKHRFYHRLYEHIQERGRVVEVQPSAE